MTGQMIAAVSDAIGMSGGETLPRIRVCRSVDDSREALRQIRPQVEQIATRARCVRAAELLEVRALDGMPPGHQKE